MIKPNNQWSRRKFIAVSGAAAAAAHTAAPFNSLGQTPAATASSAQTTAAGPLPARSLPPEVISGGIQPLLEGHTARPLRYKPGTGDQAGEFIIRNGEEFFNRPIYGPPDTAGFRVDAGDKPEFSLYLPGHGGNLKLGFIVGERSKWAADADEVIARYRPGRMIYQIRDSLLGDGTIRAELLTAGEGSGLLLKVEGGNLPDNTRLAWAFGGVSGRKGRRGGDIGCEVEPVSQFFQVRAEECEGNSYSISRLDGSSPTALLQSKAADLTLWFPPGHEMRIEDFASWSKAPRSTTSTDIKLPILTGSIQIGTPPFYLGIARNSTEATLTEDDLVNRFRVMQVSSSPAPTFSSRSAQVDAIARSIKLDTPDEFINAAGPALAIAAEALWDSKQNCIMHGAVAWRQAFAGWRGPYALDALGTHERAVANFRHWIAKQNTSPITTSDPATGPWDPNVHLTRKEALLHSNGDVEHTHYDMNLVFFDALLRHLMWTGDLDFAREVWPALERHLAWEHRLFRRTYKNASGEELPLYEAYAAIWASDNLQYSGGGAAHSSAYMVFALRNAAKLARLLGNDGSAYQREADLILRGMNELLWVEGKGIFGESKDLLGPQTVYTNPALWTVYHTIDSEVPTPEQARRMAAERLYKLKHIPIHGEGVPTYEIGRPYMLSCSNWLPYMWSLNLLLLAENSHFSLALWQAGMSDEAFNIFQGALLDSMYMGLCPGDLHMTSALDVHRQEAQRDFGDPIGITSRALIEGLFGIQPDLLAGEVRIRPGFPSDWDHASLKHKDFDFSWKREGLHETCEFTSRLPKEAALKLRLPAQTTSLPIVTCNGRRIACSFDPKPKDNFFWPRDESERPQLTFTLSAAPSFHIAIAWHGSMTVLPLITNAAAQQSTQPPPMPPVPSGIFSDPIDLTGVLTSRITDIFTRVYAEPRSPYCSLSFPDNLLGGWANPDGRALIDDAGLRAANGRLKTAIGVDFATPKGDEPNALFLSYWKQDQPSVSIPLHGKAQGIYLLMAGTTMPQCSRMDHATVWVTYSGGATAKLALRNPETWWPIEQDYLLDDYLFVNRAPLPPRVDLRTGFTRFPQPAGYQPRNLTIPGGSATILYLPLNPAFELNALNIKAELYGPVIGLLAASLART